MITVEHRFAMSTWTPFCLLFTYEEHSKRFSDKTSLFSAISPSVVSHKLNLTSSGVFTKELLRDVHGNWLAHLHSQPLGMISGDYPEISSYRRATLLSITAPPGHQSKKINPCSFTTAVSRPMYFQSKHEAVFSDGQPVPPPSGHHHSTGQPLQGQTVSP